MDAVADFAGPPPASGWPARPALDLTADTGDHHGHRQRHRDRGDLLAPGHRLRAARRRAARALDERQLAQRARGAGRGAPARPAHDRARRLRRRPRRLRGAGRPRRRHAARSTSRASRRRRRPPTTSCGSSWRHDAARVGARGGRGPGRRLSALRLPAGPRGGARRLRAQRRARRAARRRGRLRGRRALRGQAARRGAAAGEHRVGRLGVAAAHRGAPLPHPRERPRRRARCAGRRRRRHLRRLPRRAARSRRPPLSLPVRQLHRLRPALHDRARRALRPAADHDGRLRHVPRVPGRVRRSGRPSLPRAAQRVPASAVRPCGWATATGRRRDAAWPPPPCSTGRSWPSRAWAAITSRAARTTSGRWRGCARASTARTGRSRSWCATSRRRGTVVELGETDARLLAGHERPIVLAPRRADAPVAAAVAPRSGELGVMLPYSPLHHLLAHDTATTLVMTSGNVSDEPIAYRDGDARERLAGIADHVLLHDRPIQTRTDDSVVRAVGGRPMMLRRSRGHVPAALALPLAAPGAAGLRGRAQEHLLRGQGRARLGRPPHRRPAQRGDAALVHRGRGALRGALRRDAGGRRPRPAPRLPVDHLRAGARGRRARRPSSTITPIWRRCSPSTASAARRSGRSTTAPDTARRHGLGRRAAGRRPGGLRARRPSVAGARCPAATARCASRGGWPARGWRRRSRAEPAPLPRDRAAHLARGRASSPAPAWPRR